MTYQNAQNAPPDPPILPNRKSAPPSETTALLLPSANSHGRSRRPLSSVKRTFGNIVISVVGAGVLGLPYAVKQSGWLAGSIVLTVISFACYYTMMLLVHSKRKVESAGNDGVESYSELGYATFGKTGEIVVDLAVVLSQGGFCVAYFIFMGENLATVFTKADQLPGGGSSLTDLNPAVLNFSNAVGSTGLNWQGKAIYVWILFPFQVWLASIRSLTKLAPFSIFADVANFAAMAVVMSVDVVQFQRGGFKTLDAFTGWSSLPFVIGVSVYAYEGYGLVLPIESNMKDRSKFGSTLASALAAITALFICFGCLGFFAFGDATQDIITLNLGTTWQTTIIKLALCLGIFFTFPVMMHPVHEVVERRFKGGRPSILLRTLTVLAIAWIAVGVPHFGDFLSLLGSSVCCILSYVLPGLLHLRSHWGELRWWEALVDYGFIIFGTGFGIWGTATSLKNW